MTDDAIREWAEKLNAAIMPKGRSSWTKTGSVMRVASIETAARELLAMQKEEDAERLDWLIDNCPYFPLKCGAALPTNSRAAIDAARKEQGHG